MNPASPITKNTVLLKPLSEFERKEIQWFPTEKFKIPRGKLTLFVGDPGDGKSFVLLKIIAETSVSPGGKFIVLSEDDPSDMLKGRIEDMGGKPECVHVLFGVKTSLGKEKSFYLKTDLDVFEDAIKTLKPDLVMLDPLVSYTSGVNTFKGDEVRAFLDPVVKLAAKYEFALVGVIHLNKADTKAIYKITDSTQYAAIARSIYIVGKNPNPSGPNNKVVCHLKTNISKKSAAYTFRIESGPQNESRAWLIWGDETDLTADDLVRSFNSDSARPPAGHKGEIAKALLKGRLSAGPCPSSELEALASELSISEPTLNRLRKELGVESTRVGGPEGYWELSLPLSENRDTLKPLGISEDRLVEKLFNKLKPLLSFKDDTLKDDTLKKSLAKGIKHEGLEEDITLPPEIALAELEQAIAYAASLAIREDEVRANPSRADLWEIKSWEELIQLHPPWLDTPGVGELIQSRGVKFPAALQARLSLN